MLIHAPWQGKNRRNRCARRPPDLAIWRRTPATSYAIWRRRRFSAAQQL